MDKARSLADGGSLQRLTFPVSLLLVLAAFGLLLWEVQDEFDSPVVMISTVLAVVGVTVPIIHWLSNMFAPPLGQAHFGLAMAEQKKIIQEGNAQLASTMSELAQQVATQTQLMSELSGDIRSLLEIRSVDAGSPAPPSAVDD